MNKTNFEHAAFALLTGDWWAVAAAGAFFFLGREHAQFEFKLVKMGKAPSVKVFIEP